MSGVRFADDRQCVCLHFQVRSSGASGPDDSGGDGGEEEDDDDAVLGGRRLGGLPEEKAGGGPPPSGHPGDWVAAVDAASGGVYYYHRTLGLTSWRRPVALLPTNPLTRAAAAAAGAAESRAWSRDPVAHKLKRGSSVGYDDPGSMFSEQARVTRQRVASSPRPVESLADATAAANEAAARKDAEARAAVEAARTRRAEEEAQAAALLKARWKGRSRRTPVGVLGSSLYRTHG